MTAASTAGWAQVANLRYRKDGAYGLVAFIRPEPVVFIRPD